MTTHRSRLIGRLFYCLISLTFAARVAHATPPTTTITDIVYRADGTAAGGTLLFTRLAPAVAQVGNGSGGAVGFLRTASLVAQTGANYTNATTTPSAFASWSLPAAALNWSFDCNLTYQSSATTASLALSINASQAPASEMATAQINTNTTAAYTIATATSAAAGTVAVLTGGAPNATATNYAAHLFGTVEASATAGTFAVQAAAGGTGTLTILRGSFCRLY